MVKVEGERRGHPISPETRRKIGEANKKHWQNPDFRRNMSLERGGGVWIKAYPLLLRGGSVEEIAKITALEKSQIGGLRNYLRQKGQLTRPTREETNQRMRRAHLGKPSRSERVYTSSQEKAFLLARKFLEADLFTEDLSAWNELQRLYHTHGRPLPGDFADQLRLEVFLRARGSRELFVSYKDFGDGVDPTWFDSSLRGEEDFIAANTALGLPEDENGYYRVVDGRRSRPIEIIDGRVVVLNGDELVRRERLRNS